MDFDEDNEDEEVSIDFSKIKNLFKRKKKASEDTKQELPQEEPKQEKVEEIKIEKSK